MQSECTIKVTLVLCTAYLHECTLIQLVTMGILKYCLRGLLGDTQRETLFCLFDVLTEVLSVQIVLDDLYEIEQRLHLALARMERDFPVSIQVCLCLSIAAILHAYSDSVCMTCGNPSARDDARVTGQTLYRTLANTMLK